MTIEIIRVMTVNDPFTGQPASRSTDFIINSGGGAWYRWSRGGLPLQGNVQTILNAEEADLYTSASTGGQLATDTEIAWADSRAWFAANSGAVTAIFGGTVSQMDTNLANLITAMFPSATANQRIQMRYALMAGLLTCRSYANQEGLL